MKAAKNKCLSFLRHPSLVVIFLRENIHVNSLLLFALKRKIKQEKIACI